MEKHNALFTCPDWWHLQPQTLDLILVAGAEKSPMGPGRVVNHRGLNERNFRYFYSLFL